MKIIIYILLISASAINPEKMAIIVIESGGGGCNPFIFLAILFPPLLLVFGIYYLIKKLWTCGFLLLFIFIVDSVVAWFVIRLFIICNITITDQYCPSDITETTPVCITCPLNPTINSCDKIAQQCAIDRYDYIFQQCMMSCMKTYSCQASDSVVSGYFCNVIRYDIGIISTCPELQSDCEKIVFNITHQPNMCKYECFANNTFII